MKKAIKCIIALLALTLFLPPISGAETRKSRLYSYLTKMHVIPIGFIKAPANAIIERRGVGEFEDGEIATYLMRGSTKGTGVKFYFLI